MRLCGHCVERVFVYASQTIFLSVWAWNLNKGLELENSRETGSGRGEEGSREDTGQSAKEDRRRGSGQRRAEETSRREIAVQRKDGQQKEAVREDSQTWVGILSDFCRCFGKKKNTQGIVYRCTENAKCHKTLSRAWSWLRSVFARLFFFLTLSVVFYVAIKKCVIPLLETTG